jgi:hypothetical protein
MPLDVDFIVSQHFVRELSSRRGWKVLRHQLWSASAVVLPAFNAALQLNEKGKLTTEKLKSAQQLAIDAAQGAEHSLV